MDDKMDGMGECGMLMYFHFRYCEDVVLFNGWSIKDVGALIGTMIAFMALAFIYESIKFYREYLFSKCRRDHCKSSKNYGTSQQILQSENHNSRHTILSKLHLVQTGLHALQMTISYLLMLVFMTYNFYLCLSVVLGATIGYFTFAWRSRSQSIVLNSDCCH